MSFTIDYSSVTSLELTFYCQSMRITEFSSHMAGFGIYEDSLHEIAHVLESGIIIPSHILQYDWIK